MSHFLAKVGSCWNWAAVLLTLSNVAMGRCGSFVAVDGKRLERLTSDAGFPGVPGVYRNGAGTELFAAELPLPSSPWLLSPQHDAWPAALIAQTWEKKALIER